MKSEPAPRARLSKKHFIRRVCLKCFWFGMEPFLGGDARDTFFSKDAGCFELTDTEEGEVKEEVRDAKVWASENLARGYDSKWLAAKKSRCRIKT